MTETHDTDTAGYYDRLTRWTAAARFAGYGGGRAYLTVHRALADPRAGGRPTRTRLHDIILDSLPPMREPHVLDAGCGFGGTMIDFAKRLGGTYVGITLSRSQRGVAAGEISSAGLAAQVHVDVGSYDAPPRGPFALIVAIESLAHSAAPAGSLSALAATLGPGGVLTIVDDMPADTAAGAPDLERFKAGWRCPVLWSGPQYLDHLGTLGLQLLVDRDLSPDVRPRSLAAIRRLEELNKAATIVPSAAWRQMLKSYRAGLALERMYRRGDMQYRLLMARAAR